MKRVLLLLPTTGYRNNDFPAAAKKLGRSLARVGRTSRMDLPIALRPPELALSSVTTKTVLTKYTRPLRILLSNVF
jgi:hypothetical protein